uniref:EKC/KEOPS complex subunit Tprkb-like n=1 Tax=Phallusia mammillata TaxID=59560 RepID=A0A6F9DUR8_9ASCI|nr:EKC/KEOPS complex subunit Tprkb-like [Phallusia mammillata]
MDSFSLGPLLPDVEIAIGLYNNVSNCKDLKEKISEGNLCIALVKAEMIVDTFQLLVAASKAFYHEVEKQLKTRTVFTEILYNLSPSNKISECFKLFGVNDTAENIIVVCRKNDSSSVRSEVQGNLVSLSLLDKICDKELVKKLYKITESEVSVSPLVDCVVSQMIAKEVK